MSWAAFLYAAFVQMKGSELGGNAWGVEAFKFTLQNLHSIQGFFGWITLVCILIISVIVFFSVVFGGKGFWAAFVASGCFGYIALITLPIWIYGFFQLFLVGWLAANFTIAGAANPGFWLVLLWMILTGWA